ncbi:MAG: carboxypeptidase regulatory-like domain-containing protein [Planctomycetota bacterium]
MSASKSRFIRLALTAISLVAAVTLVLVTTRDRDPIGAVEVAPRDAGSTTEGRAALVAGDDLAQIAASVGSGRVGAGRAASVRLAGPGRLDGVVLERDSGAGVSGATVRLLPVPPVGADVVVQGAKLFGLGGDFAARVRPIATAVADGSGAFTFRGVREGRWFLDATAPHHALDVPATARVLASGDGGPAEIWMRAGGRVVGEVVGPDGGPVPGAEVALTTGAMHFLEAMSNGEVAMLRTTADDAGRFAFRGVVPAEGYELAAIGDGIAISHALDVAVRAGEDTHVVIVGRPGGTVRGRMMFRPEGGDAAPLPLAGARVGALPRGLRHLKLAREILIGTHAVTGADGSYEIHGLPSGSADLLAMADGHVPGRGPLVGVAAGTVAVAPDFVLQRGPMVRGRVVDADGVPVAGARALWNIIDVRAVEGQPSLAPLLLAGMRDFAYPESDPSGRFVAGPFTGRPPYSLRVVAPGFETARLEWQPSAAGASVDGVLSPESLDEVVVELRRGGGVSGVVVDASSEAPVASFTVAVSGRIESNPAAPSRWNPFARGVEVEHPEGRFRIDEVAPGRRTIEVQSDGYLDGRVELDVVEGGTAPDVVVRLTRGSTVRGTVVDPDGSPVAGAQITTEELVKSFFTRMEASRAEVEDELAIRGARNRGRPPVGFLRYAAALGLMGSSVTTSAPDGTFEVLGLEPGPHEVLAFHRSFRPASVPVEVLPGDETEPVTVEMTEGGGLRGTVEDRFGRPVADATVIAMSPGLAGGPTTNGDFHQSRTSTDGSYEMLHMEGGPYFLIVTRGDEHLALTSFLGSLNFSLASVPGDRVVTHDLVDTSAAACRVHGFVLRDGAPVDSGIMLALNLDAEGFLGLDFKAAPIENDGRYAFEGLAPGEYQLTYEGRGRTGGLFVDVPDAPELRHDVELPDGSIRGRLVDASTGEPVGRGRLTLRPLDRIEGAGLVAELLTGEAGVERTRVSADGTFRFRRLAEGEYRLDVDRASSGERGDAVQYAPPGGVTVDLGADEDVDLGDVELDPGATVEGIVRNESGRPVPSAEVFATSEAVAPSGPRKARADEEGRFRVTGLGPGDWRLSATGDGYAAGESVAIAIEEGDAGEPREVDLEVVRGTEVTVLVLDASGAPRAGVGCALVREGESTTAAAARSGNFFERFFTGGATTGPDGTLALGRYAAGRYELRATKGLGSARRSVELAEGGTRTLRITLD